MAEQNSDDDRTEEATTTRREDFRKKGQVAQTKELGTALTLLIGAFVLLLLSGFLFEQVVNLFQFNYGAQLVAMVQTQSLAEAGAFAFTKFALLLAPFFGIFLVVGTLSTVLQIGFLQVEDAMVPKFEKIDPISGFKRIFSLRSLVEGLKSIFKILIIGGVAYLVLRTEIDRIPQAMNHDPSEIAKFVGWLLFKLLLGTGLGMVILSGADYFFQWWDTEKKMMMTKKEVKDELKNRELDPQIRAKMKAKQRELANRRMMQKVPQADVIITNPTHIAVALKYDDKLPAPQLIAKGADLVAEKIKEIAREAKIPVVENKPLARTIFKTMELGEIIPKELYVAVAEVLSYVYKLRKKMKRVKNG